MRTNTTRSGRLPRGLKARPPDRRAYRIYRATRSRGGSAMDAARERLMQFRVAVEDGRACEGPLAEVGSTQVELDSCNALWAEEQESAA